MNADPEYKRRYYARKDMPWFHLRWCWQELVNAARQVLWFSWGWFLAGVAVALLREMFK